MTALLGWFLSNPTILAIGGGLVAVLVAFFRGRMTGAQRERDKQAAERLKAKSLADEVDNDIGALPPDEARKELGKWSKN